MRRSGATIRYAAGRLLVFAGSLAAAWSAATIVSGGFALRAGTLGLSSRDFRRPVLVAVSLLAAARLLLPRDEFGRAVRRVTGDRGQVAPRLTAAVAVGVLIFSIAWNTRAAGGSDSSCYVLQADAFTHGRLVLANPLPQGIPGATPAAFAPTGFVPSSVDPTAAVPICGSGLALAMAAASVAGRAAVFSVVPLCAALAVWLTYVLGRRLDEGLAGVCAAVLLATSPIFLYQSVQPMSDVPAAALWLAALVLLSAGTARGQAAAGVCASLAVLTRPNVALIVVPLLALLPDRRAWFRFGSAALPGLALMAWLNAARYGSPFASGYGSTGVLFSIAHVGPNLARYPRWLFETETPFLAAALLAPWWARRHRARAAIVLVALASAILTLGTYLAYTVFDDWWYIRFLLPALPVLIVLGVVSLLEIVRGRPRVRAGVAIAMCGILGAWRLHVAGTHRVLDLQGLESRFVATGRYASRSLPVNAVVLAVQESGSVRYHGGRTTIAWDGIVPDGLDAAVAWLRRQGRPVFIVLEDAEEPRFRARFSSQRFGGLEWPPHVEINGPVRVHVYAADDLERYLGGASVATEHVR